MKESTMGVILILFLMYIFAMLLIPEKVPFNEVWKINCETTPKSDPRYYPDCANINNNGVPLRELKEDLNIN